MKLSNRTRSALAIAGLLLFAAAAASTIAGREVVATALVAGGIAFAAVAIIGVLPEQMTLGGVGVKYRAMVAQDLRRALEDYTTTYRGDIVPKERPRSGDTSSDAPSEHSRTDSRTDS